MIPQNKEQFGQFILRRLGAPVIQINISEEQLDDCIDQALYYWQEFHMDGNEKQYYKYQVTDTDINNSYITLPDNIIGAVSIFPVGQAINTNSMFNMRYQFVINDLYNLANISIVPYFMVMMHLSLLEEMLVGQKPIRYNRHNNILYLDMDVLSDLPVGTWLVVECYGVLDPETYVKLWKDRWLQDYTAALVKDNGEWFLEVSKAVMPSGISLNGQEIEQSAQAEILKTGK